MADRRTCPSCGHETLGGFCSWCGAGDRRVFEWRLDICNISVVYSPRWAEFCDDKPTGLHRGIIGQRRIEDIPEGLSDRIREWVMSVEQADD